MRGHAGRGFRDIAPVHHRTSAHMCIRRATGDARLLIPRPQVRILPGARGLTRRRESGATCGPSRTPTSRLESQPGRGHIGPRSTRRRQIIATIRGDAWLRSMCTVRRGGTARDVCVPGVQPRGPTQPESVSVPRHRVPRDPSFDRDHRAVRGPQGLRRSRRKRGSSGAGSPGTTPLRHPRTRSR